ncbi:TonB-dependent receptor plug domain-containing protein [Planctomycetota bacterium]
MKVYTRLATVLVLVLSSFPTGVLAQDDAAVGQQGDVAETSDELSSLLDMPLEDLMNMKVVTASKKEENIDDSPNVMHVITREDIKRYNYKFLGDAMKRIPGVFMHKNVSAEVAGVRGLEMGSNDNVVLMYNGHNVTGLTEAHVFEHPIIESVKQIEVIIGPGSVLYGANTVNLIVNIVTDTTSDTELSVSAGNYDFLAGSVRGGTVIDETKNVIFSVSGIQRDGYNLDDTSSGWEAFQHIDAYHKVYPTYVAFGQAQLDNWQIQGYSSHLEAINHNILQGVLDSNGTGWPEQYDARRYEYEDGLLARNKRELGDGLSTLFEISVDQKRMLRQAVHGSSDNNYDLSQRTYGFEASVQYETDRHYLQGGFQYQLKSNRHNYYYAWDPDANNIDDSGFWTAGRMHSIVKIGDTRAIGLYLSEDYQATDKLKLTAAIRMDKDNTLESDKTYFSPRLAAVFRGTESWTGKVMYNTSRKIPAPWMTEKNQLWGNDKGDLANQWFNTNPTVLEPQTIHSFEVQSIHYYGNTRLSVNAYYNEVKDLIAWVGPFTNSADLRGHGVEGELLYSPQDNFTLRTNCAYTMMEYDKVHALTPGQANPYDPTGKNEKGEIGGLTKWMANLLAEYYLLEDFSICGTLRYLTKQVAFSPSESRWVYINDQFYLDLALRKENLLVEGLALTVSGENLTNNTHFLSDSGNNMINNPRGLELRVTVDYVF